MSTKSFMPVPSREDLTIFPLGILDFFFFSKLTGSYCFQPGGSVAYISIHSLSEGHSMFYRNLTSRETWTSRTLFVWKWFPPVQKGLLMPAFLANIWSAVSGRARSHSRSAKLLMTMTYGPCSFIGACLSWHILG